MGRNCISGDDDKVAVSPAVELAVEILVLGGLAAALALFDAFPEAVHSEAQLRDVSLPCVCNLSVVVSNPRADLLRRHFFPALLRSMRFEKWTAAAGSAAVTPVCVCSAAPREPVRSCNG